MYFQNISLYYISNKTNKIATLRVTGIIPIHFIRGIIVIDPINIFEISFLPFPSILLFPSKREAKNSPSPSSNSESWSNSIRRVRSTLPISPRRRTVENIGAILAKSKQNRRNRIYASNSDRRSRAPFEGGDNAAAAAAAARGSADSFNTGDDAF